MEFSFNHRLHVQAQHSHCGLYKGAAVLCVCECVCRGGIGGGGGTVWKQTARLKNQQAVTEKKQKIHGGKINEAAARHKRCSDEVFPI